MKVFWQSRLYPSQCDDFVISEMQYPKIAQLTDGFDEPGETVRLLRTLIRPERVKCFSPFSYDQSAYQVVGPAVGNALDIQIDLRLRLRQLQTAVNVDRVLAKRERL
jgi:hypothetical protein